MIHRSDRFAAHAAALFIYLAIVMSDCGGEPVRAVGGDTDQQQRPMIVAHRGLLRHAPESTLQAFRACLELRFGFELDVRRTRDGQLVCVHDASVDRTTNRSGRVADLTLEELRELDAGSWFDPAFAGIPVPSVQETFALLAEYPPAAGLIAVDLKDAGVEQDVVALAKKCGVLDRLVFIGRTIENPDVRRGLKQANRRARVAQLVSSPDALASVLKDPAVDWAYVRFLPSAAEVEQVHQAGKRVFLAGPLVAGKEPENWRTAAQAGVDAVLTDYPLELAELLRNCCAADAAASESSSAAAAGRRPRTERELQFWLQNTVWYHGYTVPEISAALDLTQEEIEAALERFDIRPDNRPPRQEEAPLLALPYPGGRHPRIGFLDGAIDPQRDTKASVFTPWDPTSYVVVDLPEAIWSNLGLTYLAHTHIPTIWTQAGIELQPREWKRHCDGSLESERRLPNGIEFGAKVIPAREAVRMELWLKNGTDQTLTDLRVQNCALLKAARGFEQQTNENKVFSAPYVACRSEDGRRWIITAWQSCQRAWGNEKCPCLHADPQFPDCAPGETQRLRGWLSFYEGSDIEGEFKRIEQIGWRKR